MCMDQAFPALPGTVRQCGEANQAGARQVQVSQCARPTVSRAVFRAQVAPGRLTRLSPFVNKRVKWVVKK
jgi:hypothetical protein